MSRGFLRSSSSSSLVVVDSDAILCPAARLAGRLRPGPCQVKRIGAFKSAGDQLLRRTMAPEQRQQLAEIQDDVVQEFLRQVSTALNKTPEVCVACCFAARVPACASPCPACTAAVKHWHAMRP